MLSFANLVLYVLAKQLKWLLAKILYAYKIAKLIDARKFAVIYQLSIYMSEHLHTEQPWLNDCMQFLNLNPPKIIGDGKRPQLLLRFTKKAVVLPEFYKIYLLLQQKQTDTFIRFPPGIICVETKRKSENYTTLEL